MYHSLPLKILPSTFFIVMIFLTDIANCRSQSNHVNMTFILTYTAGVSHHTQRQRGSELDSIQTGDTSKIGLSRNALAAATRRQTSTTRETHLRRSTWGEEYVEQTRRQRWMPAPDRRRRQPRRLRR